MRLSDLAFTLERLPAVGRHVIDQPGVPGRFNYDLEWMPTVLPAGVAAQASTGIVIFIGKGNFCRVKDGDILTSLDILPLQH
jgi:uncharacterized protein DUF3738